MDRRQSALVSAGPDTTMHVRVSQETDLTGADPTSPEEEDWVVLSTTTTTPARGRGLSVNEEQAYKDARRRSRSHNRSRSTSPGHRHQQKQQHATEADVEDAITSRNSDADRVQASVFTKWINVQLAKANPPRQIDDIFEGLRSGENLLILLEVLTQHHFTVERGSLRFSHNLNCEQALAYLDKHGVLKSKNTGAANIVDGDAKLTLGLIWQILLRYQITSREMSHSHDSQKLIIDWVKASLEAEGSGIEANNFAAVSFENGLAFNAIIACHRPDLVNMSEVRKKAPVERLQLAFTTAKEELNVEPLLSPEDVADGKANDKSIMVYTGELYNVLPHDMPTAATSPTSPTSPTAAATAIDTTDNPIGDAMSQMDVLNEQLLAAEVKMSKLVIADDFHAVKQQLDDHQDFMKHQLGRAKESQLQDLQTRVPPLIMKMPKSNPNKKKCHKALSGLVIKWNEVSGAATQLQAQLLKKLSVLQDARLKTVEDWLDHLEEVQAHDNTLRPEVLKERERELVVYQEVLVEVVVVDSSSEGKAKMDDRLAGIRQRWEVVNRFVVLRLLQVFQDRMQKAVSDPKPDIKELKSVQEAVPDHDKQRIQLQESIDKLKSEPTSRHDHYLDDVDTEVKAMSAAWSGLTKEIDDKVNAIEEDQERAKEWRERAAKLNAFLDDTNSGVLHQPLPVHDLDAIVELHTGHESLLKDLDQKLISVKDFDRSRKYVDPELDAEMKDLFASLEEKWTSTRDVATERTKALSQSQDDLQDFENQVEDIASFLNEIDSLFLKPFEELSRDEQVALMEQLSAAKDKYDTRKPDMVKIQSTSDDLVKRARARSFDPSDLESEVQTLVERWDDAEVLLDQRLAAHHLNFPDWVAELEAKRKDIPTSKSIPDALLLVEGVDEEIQRSAYQFPEVRSRQNGRDTVPDGGSGALPRFNRVEVASSSDFPLVPDVKQIDAEIVDFMKMLETVKTELSAIKEDKSIASLDEVKLLLQHLEDADGILHKLEASATSVKQQAQAILAKCSPELATVIETFTEKVLKTYADLEDDAHAEKARLEQICDLLEELSVQERWLDVAEQCYPVQSNGKVKDTETLGREIDEHSPEFDRMDGLLPEVKAGVDDKSMTALEEQFAADMERFTNLRVAAGKLSPHLAAYLASCSQTVQKMEDIEDSMLKEPEDISAIQPAHVLVPQLKSVELSAIPTLNGERDELRDGRDQLDKVIVAIERVQAHEAFAEVDDKLSALPASVAVRVSELDPFVPVEEETARLEVVVDGADSKLDVLEKQEEDKADDIQRLITELNAEQMAIESVFSSSADLKDKYNSSPRSVLLHERAEKLKLNFTRALERAQDQQDELSGVSLKELLKKCDDLLVIVGKLLVSLGQERPVATDISVLKEQRNNLQEVQRMADSTQNEGAELSALIGAQPENIQTAMQEKLDELDLQLTRLLDAQMKRETDLDSQEEQAQLYNDQLSEHVAYLEQTQGRLEGLVVTADDSVEQLTHVQRETESIAQEMAKKRVEIDCLDENLQTLMQVSLPEDCEETKSGMRELRQLFDAVMELLRDRIHTARQIAELGPLDLSELRAEIAELHDWLQAVEKWLLGQENESETFTDPTKAEQQRQKYEAVKDDLTAKQPTLEQINRDVALLLALNPPDEDLVKLEESRKSIANYYDEVWKIVDKLQRLLEKAMPEQMIGMSDWLVRVNDWLRAQNPGAAIANGADDAAIMLEDLRKCEMDLNDRSPIMNSITTMCQSRLTDPEMTEEAKDMLRKQLDVLQSNFEMTLSTVQMKQAWLQYYEKRGRKVREALTKHLLWFTEHDQNISLFVNPAVDLPVLEKQILEHGAFIASIHQEQANIITLKHLAVVLMLQATSSSGPSTDSSPLSSPEDTSDVPASFPPLPPCKLNEAITQLILRLQSLLQKATTHQHKLDDARQQLHELLASIESFLDWIKATEEKISEPVGERSEILVLQKQLETCLNIKAELPAQKTNLQQIDSNCNEFLDSSNGPDQNSSFMKSRANLDNEWKQLLVKLETRQAEIEERMKGTSPGAIQFATDHAQALQWMIYTEDQLSMAVAVNADLPALQEHNKQHMEIVQRIPQRQAEVDALHSQGEGLLAGGQLSSEDRASVENQMSSLDSHWERILTDSSTKTKELSAGLVVVNDVYDELKNFKEFILDAEDTLACADTIGGKNSEELQELMAAVAERQPAFDDLLQNGENLVRADTEIAASSALKLELFQVENRWKSIRLRLAKWAKQLGFDKDFYKMLADLLAWLSAAEDSVSVPNPSVTQSAAITDMLNNLSELRHSLDHTQRPLLAEAQSAQAQMQVNARDGGDEEKEQADHAKREVTDVKGRLDTLAHDLDAKIISLKPEPHVMMERVDQVESTWDFDQFMKSSSQGAGAGAGADADDIDSWLASAEKLIGRPPPVYSVEALSLRLSELEKLCREVKEKRPQLSSGGEEVRDQQGGERTRQRFNDVDLKSRALEAETGDNLRNLKKLEVDTRQVEFWLTDVTPTADLVASGDSIDGPAQKDVDVARQQLPNYQMLLATTTVGAELLEADEVDGPEGSSSLSHMLRNLRRLSDDMAIVAEKLLGASESKLEEIALLLGYIDDEHRRLMNWLADLQVVLKQPMQSGDAIDYVAIEAAIRSANEISTSLEDTNRPKRLNFTAKCDDAISQFGGSSDGHDVTQKRDEVNTTWDETIEMCRRRLDDLLRLQTEVPVIAPMEGMPPPPPAARDASAQELLDWLNSFDVPKAVVGDAENCKRVAAYVEAVNKYLAMKSANYLNATDESVESDADRVAELTSKWSQTQESAKELADTLPKLTEESNDFEDKYQPLFDRLTAAQVLVTGPVQADDVDYASSAVMDKLKQCKEVQSCDWQLEILPVHQEGELLAQRYDRVQSCTTPPLRQRLQQLAALLTVVESTCPVYRQSLLTTIDTWNEVDTNEAQLAPILQSVEESKSLAEKLPADKAGVEEQFQEIELLSAKIKDVEVLSERFLPLYQILCKHYPPLSIDPLHPIIERNYDRHGACKKRVDTRLKEIDLAMLWHDKILDRLKKTLLWIDERQKLLDTCGKRATFDDVDMVWENKQHPDQIEMVTQQEPTIEKTIASADRYLKLGRQSLQAEEDDDKAAALARPEGMDKEYLNDVEFHVGVAGRAWPKLKHDVKTWDDAMHRARRLHGDFMPNMRKFETQLSKAEQELARQDDPSTRDKNKLREQMAQHEEFEGEVGDLQNLCDVMDQLYQPLPADHIKFADDLQKHYDDLHRRLQALKESVERRGKLLKMAEDRLNQPDAWSPEQNLPGNWVRAENEKLVPFFFDTEHCVAQWEHPVLHQWRLTLSSQNYCHFAAYRAALKLRELCRKTSLNSCPFHVVQEVIHERGLEQQNDTYINVLSAGNTLSLLYKKLEEAGVDRINNDSSTDILLSWIFSVFDINRSGQIRAAAMKLFLVLMCNGQAAEKIKWLVCQQVDGLGYLERRAVSNVLYDANMLTKFVFELAHFSNTVVEQAVDDCFRQGAKSTRAIRPSALAKWLSMQPRVLSWLWAMEKLNKSELVNHDIDCVLCNQPIRGLRYRCKKHTSDNICQDCFWEGRTNQQHKSYHLVQEYTSQASVSERMRDVTQSFKRKGRTSLHKEGIDESRDFNVLQFVADADHTDLPKMLTEAFMEVYPAAAAPQRSSSPARLRSESPISPTSRQSEPVTPGKKSAVKDSVLLACLDEDAKHLQMLIDQRQRLMDSLTAVGFIIQNSSRLQQLIHDQLTEEISVLEHHHAKAVAALDSAKAKSGGYRPGHRDFPDSPSPVEGGQTPSPRPDYPIFDLLDVFCTQVSSSLTDSSSTFIPMHESYDSLCNGLAEAAEAMSGIARVANTAAASASTAGLNQTDSGSGGAQPSRYYVSECGGSNSNAKNDPQRIQVGREPPRQPWRAKFTFMAFPKEIPGTRKIFVLRAENPTRFRLSLRNQFGRWKDVFSFHAYGSPQAGRQPVFVSTRGTEDSVSDPLRFLLSENETDRNAAVQHGWAASFTFYVPSDQIGASPSRQQQNGHLSGDSTSATVATISPVNLASKAPKVF
eukprot:scpid1136/ scgid5197/ Dystrophin-related protein 2